MARPRKNTTDTAADNVAAVEETVAATVDAVDENMDKNVEEEIVEIKETKKAKPKVEKEVAKPEVKPLQNSDEIEVISLIPNVSYLDKHTMDYYKWESVGHSEYMTFETLSNMWRNSKGYFRNMWLKPLDERVIKKFGLEGTYKKYEFLMDSDNYTGENIKELCDSISATPDQMKFTICNKIKDFVANGEVADVKVIRAIEKQLDIDLISFLD